LSYETFCEILEYKLNESGHLDLILASFDEFKGENGQIGLKDLHRIARSIGEDISADELKQMIEEADEDGDGFVSRDEFIKLLSD
jgi:centrin-1